MTARVVVGIPTYRGREHLEEALTSLLGQRYRDVAFVLCDDASGDGTADIARAFARSDDRLVVAENPSRVGLVANWNRVLAMAVDAAPDATYFAWASDHDLWDEHWLTLHVDALDAHEEVVLVYPHVERFDESGTRPGSEWSFDTHDEPDPARRLRRAAASMVAGDMVYGLFRRRPLEAVGGLPLCVYPDRLLLARLSLLGRFRQLPGTTWHRRLTTPSTPRRQRRTLYRGTPPASSRLPWWLVHAALLVPDAGRRDASLYGLAGAGVAARSTPSRLAHRFRRA